MTKVQGMVKRKMSLVISAWEKAERENQELRAEIDRLRVELDVYKHNMIRWRHKKRGTTYREIGRGFAQVNDHPIEEMTAVVIYQSEKDGFYWVRNVVEFDDGRFESIT